MSKHYNWAANVHKLQRAIGLVGEKSEEVLKEKYLEIGGLINNKNKTMSNENELENKVEEVVVEVESAPEVEAPAVEEVAAHEVEAAPAEEVKAEEPASEPVASEEAPAL